MICTIKWNVLTKTKWQSRFSTISDCTLLQSYEYAKALSPVYNQQPSWGLIEIDGKEAGLIQIMQVGIIKNLFHAVVADRGPLWFDGFGSIKHFTAFIAEYNRQFPKRWGRKRRFIPEMKKSAAVDTVMQENKFTKTDSPPYQTIKLDLTQSLEDLRAGLHGSWRRSLVKSEKTDLEIIWDDTGFKLPMLMKLYDLDRRARQYDGPDLPTLGALGKTLAAERNTLIGMALLDNKPVGAILILCHGQGATYQVGWNGQEGRDNLAHHRLLWDSLGVLQQKGITTFDLGGVNDGSAASIKRFKTGMGGKLIELAGLYI